MELGHNYNIQCMKLFQELKGAFPATPDEVVRQCMKSNRNVKEKCLEDLGKSWKQPSGRYNLGKLVTTPTSRRFSVGSVPEALGIRSNKPRTNSLSNEVLPPPKFWVARGERRPLRRLPSNCDKRGDDGTLGPPRKISRHDRPAGDCDDCEDGGDSDGENRGDQGEVGHQNIRTSLLQRPLSLGQPPFDQSPLSLDHPRVSLPSLSLPLPPPTPFQEAVELPTVLVTPESPPLESELRAVHTLYRPGEEDEAMVRVVTSTTGIPSLEQEISSALSGSMDNSMVICGRNDSITKTFIDILPGLGPVSLPFGQTSISDVAAEERVRGTSVTQSTTSLSQGTVHCLRDVGDGTISIATTTYCGIQHSVLSPSSGEQSAPHASKSTTVLYSVNKKPVICENPFRRVFTKRKQFYQEREAASKRPQSPETSSKRLIWRHNNHDCGDECLEDNRPQPQPKCFTLNANIQPFDPFIIKHSLPGDPSNFASSPSCASVNLTLCGENDTIPPSVQLLPDGSGLKFMTKAKVEEDGTEACLEVNVNRDQSTITTLRTGSTDCTSNEISVKLVDGGNSVNIQQSQTSFPRPPPARPSSLHIPGPKYATAAGAKSVCQARATSPCTSPRYNSLPNLKGVMYENYSRDPTWGYQSHPKDEERKLAFTRALLSHQLEQLFKLERELRNEREEMGGVKAEVQDLEMKVKQQAFSLHNQAAKVQAAESGRLELDIGDLRGSCDLMVKRVTEMTGGKVPLGEDSIRDYKPYLSQEPVPEAPHCDTAKGRANPAASTRPDHRWSCSECTFANHPSLTTCEMCEMPRITMGTSQAGPPRPCFCHPQDPPGASHSSPQAP